MKPFKMNQLDKKAFFPSKVWTSEAILDIELICKVPQLGAGAVVQW